MVTGEMALESLSRLWNAKYGEYLGITPESDAEGILQDIHWSSDSASSPPTRWANSTRHRSSPGYIRPSPTSTTGRLRATHRSS